MKKAMIESGTRIQNNLDLITHLDTEMCELSEEIELEIIKDKLEVNIFDKAQTFVNNVLDCLNGNSYPKIYHF